MRKRTRRKFSSSQKADLLRKPHVEKVPIREICNQNELQPSVLDGWQHPLWDHAALAFVEAKPSSREQQLEAENAALRARLA